MGRSNSGLRRPEPAALTRAALLLSFTLVGLSACGSPPPSPVVPEPTPSNQAPASASPGPVSAPTSGPQLPPGAKQIRISISAFSWLDNDPPNSAVINSPVRHRSADGQGTFADPITVSIPGEGPQAAFPPGTVFYIPMIERYVVAEDTDGPSGPPGVDTTLNVWIDGRGATLAATNACEDQVTGDGSTVAILNPPPGLPIIAGPIYANHTCNLPPS